MADSTRDGAELLLACAGGDDQALGSLYDRYGRLAYGVALRVLRDAALAEDAVQDAFLAVWRQAGAYDPARGKVSTWILTLVHRRAVDLVRRQQRFNALAVELPAAPPIPVESLDEDVSRRLELQSALETLSSAERELLDLAYWDGLTQSQIARALGIPLGTVKSRTFTALAKLRDAAEPESPREAAVRR
jgi:RNA polymerase sigma-70 factor (ECF subfamily)